MDVTFGNFIKYDGKYTRPDGGRGGPSTLNGKIVECADLLEHSPSEVFEGVSKTGTWNSIQARLQANPIAPDDKVGQSVLQLMKSTFAKSEALAIGNRVTASVSAALGGLPVALGMTSVYHPEDMAHGSMFSCTYFKTDTSGLPPTEPTIADGTVYIDTRQGSLYVHPEPTDPRWK